MTFIQVATHAVLILCLSCFTTAIPSDWSTNQIILEEMPDDRHISRPEDPLDIHYSDNEKLCGSSCVPRTHDCCLASGHCWPGDYCFYYDSVVRCCPRGVSCIQITGVVVVQQKTSWYELLNGPGQEEGDWVQSILDATTEITVEASYTDEARSSYSSLSSALLEGANITPSLATQGT